MRLELIALRPPALQSKLALTPRSRGPSFASNIMMGFGYRIMPILIALLLSACASGARVISPFGDLRDGEGRLRPEGPHRGVDVWGNPGEAVLASADGQVQNVGEEPGVGCGKYVVVAHEQPLEIDGFLQKPDTRYCHLREQTVMAGDTIKRGQTVG